MEGGKSCRSSVLAVALAKHLATIRVSLSVDLPLKDTLMYNKSADRYNRIEELILLSLLISTVDSNVIVLMQTLI